MAAYLQKTLVVFFLVLAFLTAAAADELVYNVSGGVQNNQQHSFIFENQSSVSQPQLYIVDPEGKKSFYPLQQNGEKLETSVPADFFRSKGVYSFGFRDDAGKLGGAGDISLVIGAGNSTWKDRMEQLASDNSENRCDGDYLCFNEYYQSKTISSSIQSFRLTDNRYYLERALNYTLADWSNTTNNQCANYNCGEFDNKNTTAAMRQGASISALWRVYSATGNSEVRNKAVGYTEGSPEDCDVWNGEFDCGNSTNQAYMMNGFWDAYAITNNTDYRGKAVNLTEEAFNQSYSSPKIVSALATAYQATGNTTYRDKMYQYYQQNCGTECGSWMELNHLKSGLDAYSSTGNSYFYRKTANDVQDLQVDCLTSVSSNCTYPDQQSEAAQLSGLLYTSLKNQSAGFVNPVVKEYPSRDESLRIQPEITGSPSNPVLKVFDSQGEREATCSLNNINNSCRIDFSTFEQGIYTAELQVSESIYERRIPVPYSQRDIATEQELINFTRSSPENNCDPWNNSFACVKDVEISQSFYIGGFTDLVNSYRNETYQGILGNLSSPPYSYVDNPSAGCLPELGDFRCAHYGDVDAGEIQGSLIDSLYSSYQSTGNFSTLELARNYSSNSTEEGCRVWQDEFVCSSPEAQGLMIQGYWEAYEVTGNDSYRNVSLELVNHSDFSTGAPELSAAFWETYTWTNSTQHRQKAANMTANITNSTTCPSCTGQTFLDYGNMLVQAYQTTANSSYQNKLEKQEDNLSSICADGRCETSLLQGKAISFSARTLNTLPVTIDVDTSIDVSNTSLTVGEQTQVKCSITNTMNETSTGPVDISILPDSSFNESAMNTTAESLGYQETSNYTENVTAAEAGEGIVECRFSSPDFTVEESTTVTIEEVEEEVENDTSDDTTDSDSGSTGGGGFIPSPDPIEEPENNTSDYSPETVHYNYTDKVLTPEEADIPGEYRLTELHVRSCFSSSRTYYRNYTVLNASGCNQSGELVLYDNTSGVDVFRNFTGNTFYNISVTENETDWSKPMVYEKVEIPLSIETGTEEEIETETDAQNVEFTLNSRQQCDLKRNGEIVDSYNSRTVSTEVELVEGENNITLECGETSKSMNVVYDKPLTEEIAENTSYILLGLILVSVAVTGVKRRTLITSYHSKMFEHHFSSFKSELENENVVAAVEHYNKMSKHENTDKVQQKLMSSDVKMLTGLKMYLMSDMVTDPDMDLSADEKSRIQNSINNYVTNHEDSKIAEKIRENMR